MLGSNCSRMQVSLKNFCIVSIGSPPNLMRGYGQREIPAPVLGCYVTTSGFLPRRKKCMKNQAVGCHWRNKDNEKNVIFTQQHIITQALSLFRALALFFVLSLFLSLPSSLFLFILFSFSLSLSLSFFLLSLALSLSPFSSFFLSLAHCLSFSMPPSPSLFPIPIRTVSRISSQWVLSFLEGDTINTSIRFTDSGQLERDKVVRCFIHRLA